MYFSILFFIQPFLLKFFLSLYRVLSSVCNFDLHIEAFELFHCSISDNCLTKNSVLRVHTLDYFTEYYDKDTNKKLHTHPIATELNWIELDIVVAAAVVVAVDLRSAIIELFPFVV